MSYLIQVLAFLQGKKTTLVALLALVMSYLALKGWIGNDELVLANGILTVLGFGANVATKRLVNK